MGHVTLVERGHAGQLLLHLGVIMDVSINLGKFLITKALLPFKVSHILVRLSREMRTVTAPIVWAQNIINVFTAKYKAEA